MADIDFSFTVSVLPVASILNEIRADASLPVRRVADDLMKLSATKVGKKYSGTNNNRGDGRTTSLSKSGKIVPSGDGWSVVFDHPAAAAHHNGASEHTYEGGFYKNKNPNTWTRSPYRDNHFETLSRDGFTHPGNAANPFTLDAARELGLRSSGALKRGTEGPFPVLRAGPGFF